MARFVFELEAVLRMRKREEERAMLAMGACERARATAEREARAIEDRVRAGRADWRDRLGSGSGGVEIASVRMQAGATLRDLAELKRAALTQAAAERELERARAVLLGATSRRRAIEELRERRLAEWRADAARTEQRVIDDIVVSRPARSNDRDEHFGVEGAW